MTQVKKETVRAAIVAAAFRLFKKKGYIDSTMSQVAYAAGISRANIYVYFPSKFDLFYAVFAPWYERQLDALARDLKAMPDAGERLRCILAALLREIPAADNGFANNLMQAVSTARSDAAYSPRVLEAAERRIAAMIAACLPRRRRAEIDCRAFAHLLFMAFDGFAMHAHLKLGRACDDAVIAVTAAVLLGRTRNRKSRA